MGPASPCYPLHTHWAVCEPASSTAEALQHRRANPPRALPARPRQWPSASPAPTASRMRGGWRWARASLCELGWRWRRRCRRSGSAVLWWRPEHPTCVPGPACMKLEQQQPCSRNTPLTSLYMPPPAPPTRRLRRPPPMLHCCRAAPGSLLPLLTPTRWLPLPCLRSNWGACGWFEGEVVEVLSGMDLRPVEPGTVYLNIS